MERLPIMRYTLCFLTRNSSNQAADEVLMLHRKYPPNQGLWNGVGGRLEPGESPRACILREVHEETGYRLTRATFRGILTWDGYETPAGGLYIFTAMVPVREDQPVTWECPEGQLTWKPREWVFSSPEVVSNIPVFAPLVLGDAPPQIYHFSYQSGKIIQHEIRPFSTEWNVEL
jgi:8-oxo-dGTP diphosphatase